MGEPRAAFRLICHPAVLTVVSVAGAIFARDAENEWLSVPFALAVTATVAGSMFVWSGRPAFSILLGWMTVGLLTVISATKYKMKGFSLHCYDLVFLATDPEVSRFLVSTYQTLVLPVLLALGMVIAVAVLLFRADRKSGRPAFVRVLVMPALLASVALTFPAEALQDRYSYNMQGRHFSAFFISLLDLRSLFVHPALESRLQALGPQEPFADSVECGDAKLLPDIFFVLSESQTDIANFPQILGGAAIARGFAPAAGTLHPMNVETFGGGTWITNLSLMTGLAAGDFGWRNPYLTTILQDRVGGALPEVLARCGYRTVVQTPMHRSFVNEGPFLESIGFETVLDIDDMAAPSDHMRDNFYFDAAEAFIARNRKEDGRPLFLEIQTMFPHSPYEERLEPDLVVAGEPFHGDPGINEYLRRLAIARGDFQGFLKARNADASQRGAVVLEFGDHQSYVTKPFVDELAGQDALARPGSLAYRTYYTIATFRHGLRHPMPDVAALDVGFVSASLLEAAGLPMSPLMADLVRLRDLCGGRFHDCPQRDAVDMHLRRRVDSGQLRLFREARPTGRVYASHPGSS